MNAHHQAVKQHHRPLAMELQRRNVDDQGRFLQHQTLLKQIVNQRDHPTVQLELIAPQRTGGQVHLRK